MNEKVSIVIRGKNEEDWLCPCLKGIRNQSYTNYEIIYIDNESDDASIDIAKHFNVDKIKKIKNFLPGKAINMGIKESKGKYIVILSAHCIPADQFWLSRLVKSIKPKNIAGVYGRQLPMEKTNPDNARDLLMTFGNEDMVKTKDPFFHNANSIIKKTVWGKVNFDNQITNIEDRDWAKKVFKLGLKIKYDSKASVFHFHGLHQHEDYESFRAEKVNNLIKKINNDKNLTPEWLEVRNRNCPLVFYGNPKDIKDEISRYFKANPDTQNALNFYYGEKDPEIQNLIFLKRRVSSKVSFEKFTLDILELINDHSGFDVEALSFVDLTYINFIKSSYLKNKNKVFTNNVNFSSFAFIDRGEVWTKRNGSIAPLKKMFDSKTQFLRIAFGQSSILRASAIRTKKSETKNGFAFTFKDLKYLIR